MEEQTALEIAREWIRRDHIGDPEEVRVACRRIAQSLVSVLPETDDWAVVDSKPIEGVTDEARRYILVVHDRALFSAFSDVMGESERRVTSCERIPLDDVRIHVTDHERYEAGAHRFIRNWTLTLPAEPPTISFTVDWLREAEERPQSREERFGEALTAATGWQLDPVPRDLIA